MRQIILFALLVLIFMSLPVQAATGYSTDFESFATGTPANALTVPGITFSGISWAIFSGFSRPDIQGNALGSFSGDVTIQFDTTQASLQFGYAACPDISFTAYRNGTPIATQTIPNTACGSSQLFTFQDAAGFDSVLLSVNNATIIDNLVTVSLETVEAGNPTCIIPSLDDAVVGRFVSDASIYWEPGKLTAPVAMIAAGQSAWVYGVDSSGEYYKILWSCQTRWVQKDTMEPNYDEIWQGSPLPSTTVGN